MELLPAVIVASHNIMHGLRLDRLVPSYRDLIDSVGLDVLCIQENIPLAKASYASRIADQLGSRYSAIWDPARAAMAMVYDSSQFDVRKVELIPLSRTESLPWIERTYLSGGAVSRQFAQVVTLARGDEEVCVVNFHLQCGGAGRSGTEMRRQQVVEIAAALQDSDRPRHIVACGDTNAFCWPWRSQNKTLQYILEPLTRLGARDPGVRATHFFGRQNEPKLTHQLVVLLGRIGIDLPHRYDVICTNLPVRSRGHNTTPDSDHDLVWAAM